MKLKSLSAKPANFTLPLTLRELDGTDVQIPFTCIGRTTLDWQPIFLARLEKDSNSLIDQEEKIEAEKAKAAESASEAEEAKPKKRARVKIPHAEIAKNTEKVYLEAVSVIREVACGWELDDEFSDENIKAALTRYPGLQSELWKEYDNRIKGDRVKN